MQERADKTAAEGREWDKEQREQQLKDAITLYDKKVADDRIDTAEAQTFTRDQNLLERKDNIIITIAEVGATDPGLAFRMAERYSVNAEFSPFAEEFRTEMENWKARSDKKDSRTKLITSIRSNLSPENLIKYSDEQFQKALASKDKTGRYILSADDQLDLQKIRDNNMDTLYNRADDPYTAYEKNTRAFVDDLWKVSQIRIAGDVAPEIKEYIPTVMESIQTRHEYILQSGGMLPTFTDTTPLQLANRQHRADEIREKFSKNEGWDQMSDGDQGTAIREEMYKEASGLSITDPAERAEHQKRYASMWGSTLSNIQNTYDRLSKQAPPPFTPSAPAKGIAGTVPAPKKLPTQLFAGKGDVVFRNKVWNVVGMEGDKIKLVDRSDPNNIQLVSKSELQREGLTKEGGLPFNPQM
jgi:hypothetical protein